MSTLRQPPIDGHEPIDHRLGLYRLAVRRYRHLHRQAAVDHAPLGVSPLARQVDPFPQILAGRHAGDRDLHGPRRQRRRPLLLGIEAALPAGQVHAAGILQLDGECPGIVAAVRFCRQDPVALPVECATEPLIRVEQRRVDQRAVLALVDEAPRIVVAKLMQHDHAHPALAEEIELRS